VRRTDQRRAAVFAVYQHDVTGRPIDENLPRDAKALTAALAGAAAAHEAEFDELIGAHAKGWAVGRIAPLERAIMRVALVEMLHPELAPGEADIPPEGAIDEAVETAKRFCGSDAPGFVNGILGAILASVRDNPGSR
jgi:transcription antitermination protein NusB